jgi:hypothetical protein
MTSTAPSATVPTAPPAPPGRPSPLPLRPPIDLVRRAIGRRSFCTIATTSPTGQSHAAGVLYAAVDDILYVSTMRSSRKARNVEANPSVAVCVTVRRLPVGPPSSVQFQARAEVLAIDDPAVLALAAAGRLQAVTGHGELELPGGCFLRVTPNGRLHTYGLGMSLVRLLRDPLAAAGVVDLGAPGAAGS